MIERETERTKREGVEKGGIEGRDVSEMEGKRKVEM